MPVFRGFMSTALGGPEKQRSEQDIMWDDFFSTSKSIPGAGPVEANPYASLSIPVQEGPTRALESLELRRQQQARKLPEGITPVGAAEVEPQAERAPGSYLGRDEAASLLQAVQDPESGLTELKLPDGTTVKGITNLDKINEAAKQLGMPTTGAEAPEVGAAGFLSRVKEFGNSPALAYTLGRIAQAIVPDTKHGINVGAQLGIDLATSRAYDEYVQELRSGKTPDQITTPGSRILTPEMKTKALTTILDERRQGIQEEYTKQLTEQSKAIEEATPPWPEKFQHELELAGLHSQRINLVTRSINLDQSGKRTGARDKHLWAVNPDGSLGRYIGPDTSPDPSGGSDPNVRQEQWYKQAYREAAQHPTVTQYIKALFIDNNGNPIIQWSDPAKGKAALNSIFYGRLKLMESQGLVPEKYLYLVGDVVRTNDNKVWRIDPLTGNYVELD